MNGMSFGRWITRFFIIVFWLSLVYVFLYAPYFINQFRQERSISVLGWPTMIDAESFADFEQETGIKVRISYFENNEELFVKLRSGQGEGYDLIMPSDYTVTLLRNEGLIKPFDTTKFNFTDNLYAQLRGHYFDPDNQYTVPYSWSVYGLGVDTDYFGGAKPDPTWKLIFDKNHAPQHIGMLDDAREIALIASHYLFGKTEPLNDAEVEMIIDLLMQQKSWVTMYTDMRPYYLLVTKTCPVVVTLSSEIGRIMALHPNIDFVVPREGSFTVIDSFALSSSSKKDEMVYSFLNYMYRPNILKENAERFGFVPPRHDVMSDAQRSPIAKPTDELFSTLHFFRTTLPENILNKVWIRLKS